MKLCVACGTLFEGGEWTCPSCGFSPPDVDGFPAFAPELAHECRGFRADSFRKLASLEEANFWFRSRNELIAWTLRRFFPTARQLMEIGCGTGYVLSRIAATFPHAGLTGSEVYTAGLSFASSRVPCAKLVQLDARRIPYFDHFDVIGAFDVLEHIVEDEVVLVQIHRALRPGGGLVLTVPQHEWLWSRQDERACHVRRYKAAELRRKLRSAGFSVRWGTSFVSLLIPLMWLSRWLRDKTEDDDACAELRVGRFANALLGGVMAFERALIQAGLRFPMGGSLLIVARKEP